MVLTTQAVHNVAVRARIYFIPKQNTGLRRGSALSPFLFIWLVMAVIKGKTNTKETSMEIMNADVLACIVVAEHT